MLQKFLSKKLLVTVLMLVVILAAKQVGIPMDVVKWAIGMAGGYVGVQGVVDCVQSIWQVK